MRYRLRSDETLSSGVRRIADEQMQRSVELLSRPGDDPEEAVHDARKCFKKIRAVLRLVRSEIGTKTYRRENTLFRDAGRNLSAARDSAVRIRTLDELCEYYAEHPADFDFTPLRKYLVHRHEIESRELAVGVKIMERVATTVQESRKRIADWRLDRDDFSAIRQGLYRAYDRGQRALKQAYAEPTVENFHALRKRVKDHWYHIRIIRPAGPKVYGPLAARLKILSELLGDEHDLSMLRPVVVGPDFREVVGNREILCALIDRRRSQLRERIRPAARRIYKKKPERFIKQVEKNWSTWRKDSIASLSNNDPKLKRE